MAAYNQPEIGSQPKRIEVLDLFRFGAALMVVIFHLGFRGGHGFTQVSLPSFSPIARYGYLGVQLFFLISGFVISLTASRKGARGFVISRVARLYPAFWGCCAITFALTTLLGTKAMQVTFPDFLVNLTMIPAVFKAKLVSGVYWSLQEEIKFYFLVWLVILTTGFKRYELFLWTWATLVLLNLFFPLRIIGSVLTTQCAPYFIAGSVYYFAFNERWSAPRACLCVLMGLVSLHNEFDNAQNIQSAYGVPINHWVVFVALLVFNVLFVLLSLHRLNVSAGWFMTLGGITYPLYLIHEYPGYILMNHLPLRAAPAVIVSVLLALGAACLIHFVLERPGEKSMKKAAKWVAYPERW